MIKKVKKSGGISETFPQIWIDGKYIGGYDKLNKYFV